MTPRGLPSYHSQKAPLLLYVPPMGLTRGSSSPRALANAAGLLSGGFIATISAPPRWITLIELN